MTIPRRCQWCGEDTLYQHYHDTEWGVPEFEDQKLFEFLLLEGAQAGLSWITVLRKREDYRIAFDNFYVEKIARYSDTKLAKLQQNEKIIRNRLKIASARKNALAFIKVQQEFGSFCSYYWRFSEGVPIQNRWRTLKDIPAETALSNTISKDLKRRGFNFVGPTIMYAFMQATGMVNDHTADCFRYQPIKKLMGTSKN